MGASRKIISLHLEIRALIVASPKGAQIDLRPSVVCEDLVCQ